MLHLHICTVYMIKSLNVLIVLYYKPCYHSEGRMRRQKQTVLFSPPPQPYCAHCEQCVCNMGVRGGGAVRGRRKEVKNLIALISVLCGSGHSWGYGPV